MKKLALWGAMLLGLLCATPMGPVLAANAPVYLDENGQPKAALGTICVAADGTFCALGFGAGGGLSQSDFDTKIALLLTQSDFDTRIGEVQASPTANTLLDRLKQLLTGIVLNTGSNIVGKVGIDQTADGTTNKVAATQATASNLKVEPAGNVASGATDSGNPVKIGGKYNSTLPTLTDGQRGDLQLTSTGSARVTLDNGASALVDKSGTITSGGVAQTLAASNAARFGFMIQNNSTGDEWFSTLATAVASQPSIRLAPGAMYESPPNMRATGAISIIGATTAQAFSAREW